MNAVVPAFPPSHLDHLAHLRITVELTQYFPPDKPEVRCGNAAAIFNGDGAEEEIINQITRLMTDQLGMATRDVKNALIAVAKKIP